MARVTDLKFYRNIGIMAHIDAGKTTTTERILYYTGKSHKIGEVHDGAATLLDSVAGVEPQTETVWRQADRYKVPRMIFSNKMDRIGANFDRCMAMIKDRLSRDAYPLQLPVGSGELFTGHIDIIERKQYVFDEESRGKTFTVTDVPPDMHDAVELARHNLVEAAIQYDDDLIEKYLNKE